MKLTKLEVERVPIPSSVIKKLVNRKLRRITLGRYPELTVEMARKEAQKVLGKIAAGLKWSQVDLKTKTLKIEDTKNHQAHILPLSGYLYDLLLSCHFNADTDFVFPSNSKTAWLVS
jgi:hypothetical protein